MASQVFKVARSFRDFDVGAMVTAAECAGCDVPFLVRNGSLVPMSAGPVPMMAAGIPTVPELMDEVEELTINPFGKLNKQLAEMNTGLFAMASAALQLAQERAQQLADAVKYNGELVTRLAFSESGKAVADSLNVQEEGKKFGAHIRQVLDKAVEDAKAAFALNPHDPDGGPSEPAGVPVRPAAPVPNPNARVGTPENPDPTGARHVTDEVPGDTREPKVPTTNETEKTVKGTNPPKGGRK